MARGVYFLCKLCRTCCKIMNCCKRTVTILKGIVSNKESSTSRDLAHYGSLKVDYRPPPSAPIAGYELAPMYPQANLYDPPSYHIESTESEIIIPIDEDRLDYTS